MKYLLALFMFFLYGCNTSVNEKDLLLSNYQVLVENFNENNEDNLHENNLWWNDLIKNEIVNADSFLKVYSIYNKVIEQCITMKQKLKSNSFTEKEALNFNKLILLTDSLKNIFTEIHKNNRSFNKKEKQLLNNFNNLIDKSINTIKNNEKLGLNDFQRINLFEFSFVIAVQNGLNISIKNGNSYCEPDLTMAVLQTKSITIRNGEAWNAEIFLSEYQRYNGYVEAKILKDGIKERQDINLKIEDGEAGSISFFPKETGNYIIKGKIIKIPYWDRTAKLIYHFEHEFEVLPK